MYGMRAPVFVAEKVGAVLGGGPLLQQTLPRVEGSQTETGYLTNAQRNRPFDSSKRRNESFPAYR